MQTVDNWRNHPVMPVAIALVVGIVIGDAYGDKAPLWVWAADMVLSIVAVSAFPMKPWLRGVGIYVATVFFGIWMCTGSKQQLQVACPDKSVTYEAVVVSDVRERGKVARCDLLVLTGGSPIKVRATLARDTAQASACRLKVGDGMVAASVLEPADKALTGGHFDYRRWLQTHGFHATTYIPRGAWKPQRVSMASLSMLQRVRVGALRERHTLVARYASLGWESRTLALLSAMTLGDKSMISTEQQQDYSVAGGSHILALSGLHIGLLYMILLTLVTAAMSLVRRVLHADMYRSKRIIVQVATLVAVWSYVMVVGCQPSVVRAATMLTVYGLVSLLNRSRQSLNTLAIAAVVMLFVNPLSLWDVGFQLSFMAVLGIVLLSPRRRLNGLLSMLWVTVSAQIGVAPLILYYFGRFSCYFLLANVLVVPCATLLLYGAVAIWLLTPFVAVQRWAADVLGAVAGWMDAGVAWIASLPGASVEGVEVSAVQVAAIYVLIFCVCRIISLTLHPK